MAGELVLVQGWSKRTALVEQFICIDCGEWLSLGNAPPPALDDLTLAIRLGEIAQMSAGPASRRWREEAAIHFWASELATHSDTEEA